MARGGNALAPFPHADKSNAERKAVPADHLVGGVQRMAGLIVDHFMQAQQGVPGATSRALAWAGVA